MVTSTAENLATAEGLETKANQQLNRANKPSTVLPLYLIEPKGSPAGCDHLYQQPISTAHRKSSLGFRVLHGRWAGGARGFTEFPQEGRREQEELGKP